MLDTPAAETALLSLLDDMQARADSSPDARQQTRADYARRLVGIVADLIRTGTVTGTVTTTGTATAQTGTITTSHIN